jgi:hypothetical protein
MWNYVLVFVAVFSTDYIYTQYLKSVQHNRTLSSCLWATAVTFTGSIAIIEYTTNHWLLIPALLGAFFGTLVGMLIKRQDHKV